LEGGAYSAPSSGGAGHKDSPHKTTAGEKEREREREIEVERERER